MRIAEVARFAGVTVRTVRHYHQLGVLPEPSRTSNGYRSYGLHALVRVLRLRSLTAAGLSLADAGAVLDRETDDDLPAALEAAEAQLDAQIEQLVRQRDLLSRARALGAPPDLPAELADLVARIAEQAPAAVVDQIRAEAALGAAVLGVARTSEMQRGLLEAPGASDYLAAASLLVQLDADAGDEEVRGVADRLVAAIAALPTSYVEAFDDAEHAESNQTFLRLLHEGGLNRAQARVLELLA